MTDTFPVIEPTLDNVIAALLHCLEVELTDPGAANTHVRATIVEAVKLADQYQVANHHPLLWAGALDLLADFHGWQRKVKAWHQARPAKFVVTRAEVALYAKVGQGIVLTTQRSTILACKRTGIHSRSILVKGLPPQVVAAPAPRRRRGEYHNANNPRALQHVCEMVERKLGLTVTIIEVNPREKQLTRFNWKGFNAEVVPSTPPGKVWVGGLCA